MSAAETFIGRDAELGLLLDVACGRGERSVVVLGGDAGVGKTRLVEELRGRLPPDIDTAFGSCIHTAHGSLPLVAISQALRSFSDGFEDAVASLPPHVVGELGVRPRSWR